MVRTDVVDSGLGEGENVRLQLAGYVLFRVLTSNVYQQNFCAQLWTVHKMIRAIVGDRKSRVMEAGGVRY